MMIGGPGQQRRFNVELFTQVNNVLNAVNYGGYSGVLTSRVFGGLKQRAGAAPD